MHRPLVLATLAGAALAVAGIVPGVPVTAAEPVEIVLNGEDNRLNAYDARTGAKRTVIASAADDPRNGLDINAEICFVPDGVAWKPKGELWFIAGEDTEQNTEPGVVKQGWGIFRLTGRSLDSLAAEQVGKLVPDSFVTAEDNPENYGCGVLPDGRVVTGDVGDQLPHEPATGQLIVWFLEASQLRHTGPDRNDFARVPHCKIDVGIGTAGGIEVDGDDVLIASNRPNPATGEPGGVWRYDTTVWPTGETPDAGCGRTDSTGEPVADAGRVGKSLFIPQLAGAVTPSDIVDSGRGTFYVSSVFTGQVAEYGRDGVFRRFVLLTTGQAGGITPFGVGVTSDGTLWVADMGVRGDGPAAEAGRVIRVRFDPAGNPLAPEVIDEGLDFPDGIGTVVLQRAAPSGLPAPAAAVLAGTQGGAGELPATGARTPAAAATMLVLAALVLRAAVRPRT